MKKILLGTTALVLLSGAAAAQQVTTKAPFTVTLGGSVRYNMSFFDQDVTGVNREQSIDTRLTLKAEAKADNGLVYGYTGRIRTLSNGGNAMILDRSAIYATGTWGAVYLGDDDDARTRLEVLNPTVGIGQADQAGFLSAGNNSMFWSTEGNFATKITYMTPSFSGFQAGVSYTPENNTKRNISLPAKGVQATDNPAFSDWFDIGAGYTGSFGQVGVKVGGGVGFAAADRGPNTRQTWNWNLGAQLSYAGFTFGGYYWDDNNVGSLSTSRSGDNLISYGLGLTYTTGPWGLGASWVQTNLDRTGTLRDQTDTVYGVGAAYQLAPGLSLQGDINMVDSDSQGTRGNDGWGFTFRTRVDF
jgi:hypothetical protein